MTNYKDNSPIYAEEQFIQQKIKIPSNFIEIGQPKKYWGSTEGLDKLLCERYNFKYNDKTVVLDISQKLVEKLGLKEKENHSFLAYVNKNLLKKTPEEGGITVDSEKDILLQTEGIVLFQEREIQVDFTSGEITDLKQKLKKSEELSQETQKLLEIIAKDNEEKHITIIFFEAQIKDLTQRITELRQDLENEILARKREESKNRELERIIKKLREDEQVLIGLQNNFTQLQTDLGNRITTLTTERDWIQGELNNLKDKLKRIQKNFLGSIFRSGKRKQKITNLNIKILQLGAQLASKNQEINRLKGQRDNLQTQLRDRDQTITNLTNQLNGCQTNYNNVNNQLSVWTAQFPNENASQVQFRINGLIAQLTTANTQKLTPDEQNAITWTNLCIAAMNNALANSNVSYLDSYQSYFNSSGIFYPSVAGGLAKYGRMQSIVTNLINVWNQTRTQINNRNSLITSYQSQISSLNSQLSAVNNVINQKDIQINNLTQQINSLSGQLTTTRNELEREKLTPNEKYVVEKLPGCMFLMAWCLWIESENSESFTSKWNEFSPLFKPGGAFCANETSGFFEKYGRMRCIASTLEDLWYSIVIKRRRMEIVAPN